MFDTGHLYANYSLMLKSVAVTQEAEASLYRILRLWNPHLPTGEAAVAKVADDLLDNTLLLIASGIPGQPVGSTPGTRVVTLNTLEKFEWLAPPLAIVYKVGLVQVVIDCLPLSKPLSL